jgi:MFS family permease
LLGSTILLYAGQTIAVLILARLLQGVSAAVVWTIGLALVMDTVGSEKLGVTIGSIFSFISVGELLAPVLGGVVYEKAGSGGVFGMGFGLLTIDFVMRLLLIEKKIAAKYAAHGFHEEADEEEEAAVVEADEADEESPLLRQQESERWKIRKEQPNWVKIFPIIYCLRDPRLLTAQAVAFTQACLVAVFDATIPTEAQDLFDFHPLRAGIIFIPLVLPYLLLGPYFGGLVDKHGVKAGATLGFAYLVIPLLCLRIPSVGGTSEIAKFSAVLVFCGFGLAIISSPSIVESSYVVEQYHKHNDGFFGKEGPYAQLYAINSMFFCLGLTVGPLLAGVLREKIGFGNMCAVVAGMCGGISVLSYFFLGEKPKSWRRN